MIQLFSSTRSNKNNSLIGTFGALVLTVVFMFSGTTANAVKEIKVSGVYCPLLGDPAEAIVLEDAVSLAKLTEREIEAVAPLPDFVDLREELNFRWTGIPGPKALAEMLPSNASFVASRAPGAEMDGVIKLAAPLRSIPMHYNFDWRGRTTQTTLYANLPQDYPITKQADDPHLIGESYEHVVFHIHGGGTPTASGVNAMSIGHFMAKKGVPVIAPDMPGHGRSDREPQMSHEELLDWCLEMIDNLVHPNVKVTLSGHSWGGELAVALHRLSKTDAKYKRIHRIIGLSPPTDITLGGTSTGKENFDEWFEKNFHHFEDKISESDYEFLENLMASGKIAPVAEWFTNLTSLNFLMPPLSEKDQEGMTPMLVITGTADGLVYVGREEEYNAAFDQLAAPSQYVKLGPGLNFKSKGVDDLIATGHNIFDRYIDGTVKEDGSGGEYETYTRMFRFIVGEENADQWPEPEFNDQRSANGIMQNLLITFANNAVGREFLSNHVEYIEIPTPALDELIQTSKDLEKLLATISNLRKAAEKQNGSLWKARLAEYTSTLGLSDRLSVDRAEWEIALPDSTSERVEELNNFRDQYEGIRANLLTTWVSPNHEKVAALLQELGLNSADEIKPELQAFAQNKPKDKASKDRRTALTQATQTYKELDTSTNVAREAAIAAATAHLKLPDGSRSPRTVNQEIDLIENQKVLINDDRRALLQKFIDEYSGLEATFKSERTAEIDTQIRNLPEWNAEVPGEDVALAKYKEINDILTYVYVPDDAPEVNQIISDMKEADIQYQALAVGPESAAASAGARLKLLARRDEIYRELRKIWESETMTGPEIKIAIRARDIALTEFAEVGTQLSMRQRAYQKELHAKGMLTPELIKNYPQEIADLIVKFKGVRATYMQSILDIHQAYFHSSITGKFDHPQKDQIKQWMHEMFGGSLYLKDKVPSSDSLEGQILASTTETNQKFKALFNWSNKKSYHRARYLDALGASSDQTLPYTISAVKIYDLLNQPLDDLSKVLYKEARKKGADKSESDRAKPSTDPKKQMAEVLFRALQSTQVRWQQMWSPHINEQKYINLNPYQKR